MHIDIRRGGFSREILAPRAETGDGGGIRRNARQFTVNYIFLTMPLTRRTFSGKSLLSKHCQPELKYI
ncbi:MAG: hypothetical protein DBY30_01080 [Verrucomicrobia bacterium]|nr:MAG: hypothetical protein DBY30_01080 [Verrucomicrobiota bacterium]